DDCIKRNPQNWLKSIEQAKEVFDYYLRWASNKFDLNTESGKIQASQEVIPLIAATQNSVAQAFLIKKTADALALDEQAIKEEIKKNPKTPAPEIQSVQVEIKENNKKTRQELLEEYIVSVFISILSQEALRKELKAVIDQVDAVIFNTYASIFTSLAQILVKDINIGFNQIAKSLEKDDQEVFDSLNLKPFDSEISTSQSELTDAGRISHSIEDQLLDMRQAIRELNRLYIKEQLSKISRSLKQAEQLDVNQAKALREQFNQLSQKLVSLQSEI